MSRQRIASLFGKILVFLFVFMAAMGGFLAVRYAQESNDEENCEQVAQATQTNAVQTTGQAWMCYQSDNQLLVCTGTDPSGSADPGTYWEIADSYTEDNLPPWCTDSIVKSNVYELIFDEDLAGYNPTSTAYWFYGLERLESVQAEALLDTSSVTNCTGMYEGCSVLTSITVPNMPALQYMDSFAKGCTSIDRIVMQTAIPSTVSQTDAFTGISNIATLTLNKFATTEGAPTVFADDCGLPFNGVAGKEGYSWWGSSSVQDLWSEIGLASGASKMNAFIASCIENGAINALAIFDHVCGFMNFNLVQMGAFLTVGYGPFNYLKTQYLETQADGAFYEIKETYSEQELPDWYEMFKDKSFIQVKIESSTTTEAYQPISMAYWFYGLHVVEIESSEFGLNQFDTSKVVDTTALFAGNTALQSFDSTIFTKGFENVASSANMFDGCNNLTTLDLENFANGAVENVSMTNMFRDTNALADVTLNKNFKFTEDCAFNFSAADPSWKAYDGTTLTDMAQKEYAFWNTYLAEHEQDHFYLQAYRPVVTVVSSQSDANKSLSFANGIIADPTTQFEIKEQYGLPPVLLTPKTMYYRSAWKKGGKPWQRSIRTISNNKPYGSIWSKETHKELLQILVLATRL